MSLLHENDITGGERVAPVYDVSLASKEGQELYDVIASTDVIIGRINGDEEAIFAKDDIIFANAGLIEGFERRLGPWLTCVTIEFVPDDNDGLIIRARKRHEDD